MESIGEGEDEYMNNEDESPNQINESSELIMKRLGKGPIKKGFEMSKLDQDYEDYEEEEQDVVENMSQNGD